VGVQVGKKRQVLQIHPLREARFVQTPGGRVGYVRSRDAKAKTLTIRYLDGTGDDEVTVPETLAGLRVLRVRARSLFEVEAAAMDKAIATRRTKTAREGMREVRARRSGTRGAGARAAARAL
jgi:hypothetical protein